jgi:hypothetical protein
MYDADSMPVCHPTRVRSLAAFPIESFPLILFCLPVDGLYSQVSAFPQSCLIWISLDHKGFQSGMAAQPVVGPNKKFNQKDRQLRQ